MAGPMPIRAADIHDTSCISRMVFITPCSVPHLMDDRVDLELFRSVFCTYLKRIIHSRVFNFSIVVCIEDA